MNHRFISIPLFLSIFVQSEPATIVPHRHRLGQGLSPRFPTVTSKGQPWFLKYIVLMTYKIFQARHSASPSMEDDHRWKTTFDGRRSSMEDDLRWKTTFDGIRPLMEYDLQWNTTFDGRRTSMEEDLQWKTTFDGGRPSLEDNLR